MTVQIYNFKQSCFKIYFGYFINLLYIIPDMIFYIEFLPIVVFNVPNLKVDTSIIFVCLKFQNIHTE